MTVDRNDGEPVNEAARWWIEGFLAGAEPDAQDVLGRYFDDDLDSDDMKRWRRVVDEFRAKGTGFLPSTSSSPRPAPNGRYGALPSSRLLEVSA